MSKQLPKKFKKTWIKALKSGKFEQADGALYDRDAHGYCCLGVACKIAGVKKSDLAGGDFINDEHRELSDIKVPKMLLGSNGLPSKLAQMNDDGKSFKKIAKWIKKHL